LRPVQIPLSQTGILPSLRPVSPRSPARKPLEQERTHGECESRVKNAAYRTKISPPWGVENLLIVVPLIHDIFTQQKIQVMMAVLMDQVVYQIEIATIKTIDE
jgi:hypothetical protein